MEVMFWFLFAFMALGLLAIFSCCLREKTNKETQANPSALLYQEENVSLCKAFNLGEISRQEYQLQLEGLYRRIAEESSPTQDKSVLRLGKKSERLLTIAILSSSVIFGIFLYFQLGHPSLNGYHAGTSSSFTEAQMVRFLKETPDDLRALISYSRYLKTNSRLREAVEILDKAFLQSEGKFENDSDLLLERAFLLASTGSEADFLRAEQDFVKAAASDPGSINAWNSAGEWFWRIGKYDLAADYWTHLLSLLPKDSTDHKKISFLIDEAKERFMSQ